MSLRSLVATSLASVILACGFAVLPAFAADELSGQAAVRGKDTRRNTIQLGDHTFRLDSDSVIRDASGARISLRALAVPDFSRGGADLMLGSVVGRFVAEPQAGGHVLRTLDLKSATH